MLSNWEPSMATHICHLSTWEVEAKVSGIRGHLQLYSKLKAILHYMRPYRNMKPRWNSHRQLRDRLYSKTSQDHSRSVIWVIFLEFFK